MSRLPVVSGRELCKVIIIGIDGGTFDIIQPMVQHGELPTRVSLMEKGVWGELRSTIPLVTAPAWFCLMR